MVGARAAAHRPRVQTDSNGACARTGRAPTALVMLNLGGPADLDAVQPFLERLFLDREILQLPAQRLLGTWIARRRTPKVQKLYAAIGGGSPLRAHTEAQGRALVRLMDARSPETAPHRFYLAFRYAPPFADDALRAMRDDGVRRAVAFTQYPQFSCTTTGSSLNELWRAADRLGLSQAFRWSVIDRWPTDAGFVAALASTVRDGLAAFDGAADDPPAVVFSAHSLPLSVIDRGDPYPHEVAATVARVVARVRRDTGVELPHVLAFQSEVGPVRWLGPTTVGTVEALGRRGVRRVLVVPVAFTSDHIETLSELDIEVAHAARAAGVTEFRRSPALNSRPDFVDALAGIAARHLAEGRAAGPQYAFRCPGCTNAECRRLPNAVVPPEAPAAAPAARRDERRDDAYRIERRSAAPAA